MRFNLLAITGDKLTKFEKERAKLGQCQVWLQKKLAGEALEGDFSLAAETIEVYQELGAD